MYSLGNTNVDFASSVYEKYHAKKNMLMCGDFQRTCSCKMADCSFSRKCDISTESLRQAGGEQAYGQQNVVHEETCGDVKVASTLAVPAHESATTHEGNVLPLPGKRGFTSYSDMVKRGGGVPSQMNMFESSSSGHSSTSEPVYSENAVVYVNTLRESLQYQPPKTA